MHPQIQKLENDFIAFKNNPVNVIEFFGSLWIPVVNLPRDEVMQLYHKIYDWAKQHKETHAQIFALATFNFGFIAFHSEQYDEGLKYYTEAQNLFSEQNDDNGIAICNIGFGGIYRTLGNIDLALKYQQDAFHQLHKTHAYSVFETVSIYGLASLYNETKNYERAIDAFKQCIEISGKYNNKHFVMLSYDGLGEAFHQLQKDEIALEYFNKALAMGEETGNKNFYSRVLSDVGTFYFDKKDFEKAIQFHTEALKIREEINLQGGAITNLIQLSKIYQLKNDYDEALAMLNNAMSLAEELKVKPKIFQVHLMLSEIYEQKNELEKSYEHYKQYHKINEEVNIEDGEKKLKRSEMIFEAEQTKKENIIIKEQKKQIENTNIVLQKTIHELTFSKINRKAKTITITIAILLFIIEDSILHYVVAPITHHNFFISLAANFSVVFCVKPIERIVEHYLIKRWVKEEKEFEVVVNI